MYQKCNMTEIVNIAHISYLIVVYHKRVHISEHHRAFPTIWKSSKLRTPDPSSILFIISWTCNKNSKASCFSAQKLQLTSTSVGFCPALLIAYWSSFASLMQFNVVKWDLPSCKCNKKRNHFISWLNVSLSLSFIWMLKPGGKKG